MQFTVYAYGLPVLALKRQILKQFAWMHWLEKVFCETILQNSSDQVKRNPLKYSLQEMR